MKTIKEAKESKAGNLWDWGKGTWRNTHLFTLVGTRWLIMTIYSIQRWNVGNEITGRPEVLCSCAGGCAFRDLEKKITG